MNLNEEVVREAQEILGTDNATATVHAALRDVIRQFRLQQAASLRFPDGFWEETRIRRQPRSEWKDHVVEPTSTDVAS